MIKNYAIMAAIMARPITAFREFPIVNAAYAGVRQRLLDLAESNPRPELGLIDVPLWLSVHESVPSRCQLPELGKAAGGIGKRCQAMILPLIRSGELSPEEFARLLGDRVRLGVFMEKWLERPLSGRALGIARETE
jgi:hypothetical protein